MTTLANPLIRWNVGGEAEIAAHSGMHLTVRSTRPFPPGAPVPGTIALVDGFSIELKVTNTRRVGDGVWEIRGRLLSATRELLDAIAQAVPPPPSPGA